MLLEPVIGYTRFVSLTKITLLSVSCILILILILIPFINPIHENYRLTFSSIQKEPTSQNQTMTNPRFQGIDSSDKPYNIKSDKAIIYADESLKLININADISLEDDTWVSVIANEGILRHKKKELDLAGNVGLYTNSGYEFTTQIINFNISDNYARSDSHMIGIGPIGKIEANGFEVFDKGDKIFFKENVKVTIYPGSDFIIKNKQ